MKQLLREVEGDSERTDDENEDVEVTVKVRRNKDKTEEQKKAEEGKKQLLVEG